MSIYEKLNTAMDNNDVNAYAELLHDDLNSSGMLQILK